MVSAVIEQTMSCVMTPPSDCISLLHIVRLPPRLPEPLMKRDIEMQTELHPIPSYIDPNYTWNEWELKRKAIQLANICRSKTHSTQTNNSHKRASIGVQAQQPKDVGCQTKRDTSTNVPKLQNFIFGLRGRKENIQHVISLTRPTHE
uniref:Cilia- and flagella-associated protein 206 n=1 Tax=Timema poppense TaxID=170557 RepID=A0A7R9H3L1_TIMPO|nr:unnamed protein product [Timema poppensis]